ncbi:MAG: RRXRR domain-containing protein [Bacillota bacterium]|nr:RRXRR domain-containing protein [Bacillota bacterium]
MTHVYVLSKSGNPLMPTNPARARHLLKAGEARVVRKRRSPFS